ncbi:MAG: hypothetical protein COA78_02220 [Blastopirellula sp.]|nr:MAG: hypothetical protein COA78_02220 [Blastopirellula sp.]
MTQDTEQPVPPNPQGQLTTTFMYLAYIAALLGSAFGSTREMGLMFGVAVCIYWAVIFFSKNRPRVFVLASVTAFVCMIPVMLPSLGHSRHEALRSWSKNNLKQIGLALENYYYVHNQYPPAYIADENGKPMHSWRVLILPFLEEGDLYDKYDFNEPWDGPNNIQLLDQMPEVYHCKAAVEKWTQQHGALENPESVTNYFAIIGPNTFWPGESSTKKRRILDGVTNTLIMIEDASQCVQWLEPRDLEYDLALDLLSTNEPEEFCVYQYENDFKITYLDRQGLYADVSVRSFYQGIPKETWASLLEINDQAIVTDEDLFPTPRTGGIATRTKTLHILLFYVMIFLTVFPLPWVFLNPRSESRSQRRQRLEQP